MSKEEQIEKIANNVNVFLANKNFAKYAKEFYGAEENGELRIDKVLKKTYQLALSAESERVQIAAIKEIRDSVSDKEVAPITNNTIIIDVMDNNLKKILNINVSNEENSGGIRNVSARDIIIESERQKED